MNLRGEKMSYTADDIKSLTFREGVRTRIQMYLGSADNEGTYQAFKEIVNNSTDEALCGYGNKIEIGVSEKENTIYVRDYGRGVPFRVNPDGSNVLVDIYTKAHTGGKFDNSVYKNVGGLNGIGGSCVCLSSINFEVRSYRDGTMAYAYLLRGELQTYREEKSKQPNGTWIKFNPDPEVFKDEKIGYSFERICSDIHDISYLYPGILFTIRNTDTNEERDYQAKNGIIDFIKDNLSTPLHKTIITGSASDGTDSLEIAFQWGSKHETSYVFVNGLRTPEGGSPITGAKTAITKTFNNLANSKFDGEQIRQNLFYVINCKVAAPSFANQTKSKINNASLRALASTAFTNALKQMKQTYTNEFDTIREMLKRIQRADLAAEKTRAQVLSTEREISDTKKKRAILADKLKDCQIHGPDSGSVLAICEGDSALGALVQSRPIDKVALIPIRGKIISALKHTDEEILKNEEVKAIFSALGCGFFDKYNAKKLRYQYIAVASDGDVDGSSISNLITTLFYHMCPKLIQEGRLFRMKMPLFVLEYKNGNKYAFSEEERDELIAKYGKPKSIGRKKGIGENTPKETEEAVFGEQKRWERVNINDIVKYKEMMEMLMGTNVDKRRDFIMENVDFSNICE